ncbi:MAG: EAL domain-containing protein [Cyanobacteria bacterium P01_D01_bin.156]
MPDFNSKPYLGCNRNYSRVLGSTATDMVGKTDYDMPWGAEYAAHTQIDDRQVMQSETPKLGVEESFLQRDGQQIWVETNKLPLQDLSGAVVGVLGTYQDITVRKQLELQLQSSQKQLSEVLDSAIAGIIRWRLYPDKSMQYDYISPHCVDNSGYSAEELLSAPQIWQSSVVPEDWTTSILPAIDAILSTKQTSTHNMEYRLRRKDGSICWVLANSFARWQETGHYWEITSVETDISDRKRAELQLQNLIAGTAATTGQDFFPALARHIAEALNVSYVFVAELCDGHQMLSTLAVWANGELHPNHRYALSGTPSEQIIQTGFYHCDYDIQKHFPNNHVLSNMNAESCLGVALRDVHDNVTGVFCIFHHQPLDEGQKAIPILQAFAARAAAELERQRANLALEKLNHALELKVTERTAELQEREQFLQTVLDTFPLQIFWKDRNSIYLGGNRNFFACMGVSSLADIQGRTDYEFSRTVEDAELLRESDRQVMDSDTSKLGIITAHYLPDGCQRWIETNKLPLHNLKGDVIGVLGTWQDITDKKVAIETVKQQLAAIEAAIDGIGILQNGIFIYVNQAYLNLFSYTRAEELLGQSWQTLYDPKEVSRLKQNVCPVLERDGAWQGEAVATRKDGSTYVQGVSLTSMDNGLIISVCRDISDLKQAEAQISHNALHDPLTGLPNRRFLLERLTFALKQAQSLNRYHYALLFLDLDRFKVINDSLGHFIGDKLLIEVSKRLKKYLRKTDIVARLGGDEFVILLEDVTTVEAVIQIAERILADCRLPIVINDHKIFTSASIGIVLGNEHYHDASNVIRDADIAMYRAKAQEVNSYKFFDSLMYSEVMGRLTLETDLRRALNQQEFRLCYQPIVDLKTQKLVGFEALVRWHHPSRGLISPNEFIPIAEETGLVIPLDSWVLRHACEQILDWQKQFLQQFPLKMSINLSVQDLGKASLLDEIDYLLGVMNLPGNLITLEITESMLIHDIDQTIELLHQLASRQIQISIDDFGTGYSSLSYLHRLPIHNLKIDRSFVRDMHSDNRNYQVVSTILALGRQLGLTVVAEGIETDHHLQQLQSLGCELGQGYLFSRPLTPDAVEEMLAGVAKTAELYPHISPCLIA